MTFKELLLALINFNADTLSNISETKDQFKPYEIALTGLCLQDRFAVYVLIDLLTVALSRDDVLEECFDSVQWIFDRNMFYDYDMKGAIVDIRDSLMATLKN